MALCLTGLLAVPTGAQAKLVLFKGMSGVRLGMTHRQARAAFRALGWPCRRPTCIYTEDADAITRSSNPRRRERLEADFAFVQPRRVYDIVGTNLHERTSEGTGFGSKLRTMIHAFGHRTVRCKKNYRFCTAQHRKRSGKPAAVTRFADNNRDVSVDEIDIQRCGDRGIPYKADCDAHWLTKRYHGWTGPLP
jgi:hypothetical protein